MSQTIQDRILDRLERVIASAKYECAKHREDRDTNATGIMYIFLPGKSAAVGSVKYIFGDSSWSMTIKWNGALVSDMAARRSDFRTNYTEEGTGWAALSKVMTPRVSA